MKIGVAGIIWLVPFMALIEPSIPQQISADVDVKIPLDVPSCPKGNLSREKGGSLRHRNPITR